MSIAQLTDKEIAQLTSVFGLLPLQTLQAYLQAHICAVHGVKSQDEFEQRAKILAYLTYRTNDQKTTN